MQIRQCHRDQGSRSSRAGMLLLINAVFLLGKETAAKSRKL
jgi:hypothetical protein